MTASTSSSQRFLGRKDTVVAVAAIAVIAALAHLILVPWLGFYKEDWYLIWRGSTTGGASIIPLFSADRPMAGYVYAVLYPLLGDAPLGWHLTAFAFRLAGALLVYATVRMLWPAQRAGAYAVAVLFIVYPGYLQQYHAVNKAFWLTSLTAALASLALTVASLRAARRWQAWLLAILALLLAAFYPTIIEFYIGFEAVRLALIWAIVQQQLGNDWKRALTRTALQFIPYLIPAFAFLVWRLFFFKSTRPTTNMDRLVFEYRANPIPMLARLVAESVKDFVETVFLAWTVPFNNRLYPEQIKDLLLGGLVGLLAAALAAGAYWILQRRQVANRSDSPSRYRTWLWLGAFATFITLLPLILAGRDVNFDRVSRADHYTIQASFGAALLLVGLLTLFLSPRPRLVVFALLVGISVYTHYQQNAIQRDFWQLEKDLWWQLSWRAPQLERATLLFVNLPPPFAFQEGYEAWAPADLIYGDSGNAEGSAPTITGEILNEEASFQIQQGGRDPRQHRGIWINRNFNRTLVLSIANRQACLNVIDGNKYELPMQEDPLVRLVAPYSRISQIQTDAAPISPPTEIFGAEPEHDWCYYYQKAMLARQRGDWPLIVQLGNQVQAEGFQAKITTEWMPFFEAYVNTGHEAEAAELAKLIRQDTGPWQAICIQLEAGPPAYPGEYRQAQILETLCADT